MKTFTCPHCGGDVPQQKRACPHCGASEEDGWSDSADEYGEPDFDYDEYVARDFGDESGLRERNDPSVSRAARARMVIWLIVLSMIAAIILPLFL